MGLTQDTGRLDESKVQDASPTAKDHRPGGGGDLQLVAGYVYPSMSLQGSTVHRIAESGHARTTRIPFVQRGENNGS